jgi:hypothetical protein
MYTALVELLWSYGLSYGLHQYSPKRLHKDLNDINFGNLNQLCVQTIKQLCWLRNEGSFLRY